MKITKYFLAASITSTSALAGTMGTAEAPSFNGLYLGLGAGFASIFTKDSFQSSRSNSTFVAGREEVNRYTDTAIQFNGNVGYGKMVHDKAYLGAKAAIYYTPLEQVDETGFNTAAGSTLYTGNNTIRSRYQPIYNIDGVLGYQVLPNLLPFVEAGISFADANRYYQLKRATANLTANTTTGYSYPIDINGYKTTYNVGIGMNYLMHQHAFFSLELLYNDLGNRKGNAATTIGSTGTVETHARAVYNQAVALFASASYLLDI